MKTVSMLDFRLSAEKIIAQVQKGQRMILTHRGKPVVRLEPLMEKKIGSEDPFYSLCDLAVGEGESLTNSQIDDLLYGQ